MMRRKDREVTDFNEIAQIISRCSVCRIALNDNGYPYILPLNFGAKAEGGSITLYFHGAQEGKKHLLIARDNRAGFEMDCKCELLYSDSMECTMAYESVVGCGKIEYITELDEKVEALRILMAQYHPEPPAIDRELAARTCIFKLTAESFSAKRNPARG